MEPAFFIAVGCFDFKNVDEIAAEIVANRVVINREATDQAMSAITLADPRFP